MVLTLFCVVMLIVKPTQQHKLILLLQTESKSESQLFGKYIAVFDKHLEAPSEDRAAGEGGRENMPPLIECVGLGAT